MGRHRLDARASPNPGSYGNQLLGVAAASASDAWAVGDYADTGGSQQTLIGHLDETAWRQVSSPDPGGSANDNELSGVAASSATNIWAVGDYSTGTHYQPLALHCC